MFAGLGCPGAERDSDQVPQPHSAPLLPNPTAQVINTPVLSLLRAWESNNLGQKWRWLHLLLVGHLPVLLFLPQFLSLAHGTCHSTDMGGEGFGRNLQSWPFLHPFPPEAGLGRPEGLRLQPGTPALGTRGRRCCEKAPPTHGASGAGLGGPRFRHHLYRLDGKAEAQRREGTGLGGGGINGGPGGTRTWGLPPSSGLSSP